MSSRPAKPLRVRAITAGVRLESSGDFRNVDRALRFLDRARSVFEAEYEVQTVRIATQPLADYAHRWATPGTVEAIRALDRRAGEREVSFSIGPVLTQDEDAPEFGPWSADVMEATTNISFSAFVASAAVGVHHRASRAAADAIVAISRAVPGGEGNFRFAATAFCPAGTPFFPAAYHAGDDAFSIGLESAPLVQAAFEGRAGVPEAKAALQAVMNAELRPIEESALQLAQESGWKYVGIDVSPAPGIDASIGQGIETLTGAPFGAPATLAACAAITDVLKSLDVKKCGYSGLMLPVLEDPVLARRAGERRYGISELLLYSTVCGTGLDVVPLPGDSTAAELASTIGDVAALAVKHEKALSARLLPIPGKKAGEVVSFANPHLTDAVVMPLDGRPSSVGG